MAALALLGAPAVEAAPPEPARRADPMAAFYGNMVTIAVPSWCFARLYVDPDGTWREPRGSDRIKGVWKLETDRVCSWQKIEPGRSGQP